MARGRMQDVETDNEIWSLYPEEDVQEDLVDEIEMEWSSEPRTSMHPKKGKSTNARRYVEEYWENKRLRDLQRDVLDD